MSELVVHPIEPVFDENSRILILGTMPSPKSREAMFYYAHPQNRFWRVMFSLFGEEFSTDTEKRRQLCIDHGIALWDVVKSCEIEGAADSSIKNAEPNDLGRILEKADITAAFTTGKTAEKLYKKLCQPKIGIPAIVLPSPSGANCAVSFDKLLQSYRAILPFLKQQ